jgi:hypothetical protein
MNGQEGDAAGRLLEIPQRLLAAGLLAWPDPASTLRPDTPISSAETEGD